MPRISIPSLKSLTPDHLELLKHCEKKGREIAEKYTASKNFPFIHFKNLEIGSFVLQKSKQEPPCCSPLFRQVNIHVTLFLIEMGWSALIRAGVFIRVNTAICNITFM